MCRQLGFFLLISTLTLAGCATLRFDDHKQNVLIRSKPAGAKVYAGGRFYGRTPAFVPLRRSRSDQKVTLLWSPEKKRTAMIHSHYDWKGSFFPNLVFLTGAPVGWAVDYATGYGHAYAKPPKILEPGYRDKVRVIVIAPPQAGDEYISDDVGQMLMAKLKVDFPHARIISYKLTQPQFISDGQDYNLELGSEEKLQVGLDMKSDFDASHILYSKLQPSTNTIHVSGTLYDTETGSPSRKINYDLLINEVPVAKARSWRERWGAFVHLIPNTASLDFGSAHPNLSNDSGTLVGKNESTPGFWGGAGRILNTVSVGNIEAPTLRHDWRFVFKFVPGVNVRYGRSIFPDATQFSNTTFDRLGLFAGVGPQIGLISRYGFIYGKVILGPNYTSIHWKNKDGQAGVTDGFNFQTLVEGGYNFFVTSNWYLRLYTRDFSEDQNIWRVAVSEAADQLIDVKNSDYIQVGFSIGYFFFNSKMSAR